MSSVVQKLAKHGTITNPPSFLVNNIHYETIMGSLAYGVSEDTSDVDIYGFCIPPKHIIFPHLDGHIAGFGKQPETFNVYQKHHLEDPDGKKKQYDIAIYGIVSYFQLCMDNNPNMIDSLFTPLHCVLHSTEVGNMVRDNRKLFLHKGSWFKRKGYAYSQLHKMDNKNPVGKRKELVEKYQFDVKFAYHVVRLVNNAEQILIEGDLDLTRDREQLKSIRRGEWTQEDIRKWFQDKELALEKVYLESKLREYPEENKIKDLLLNCLEHHYGNLGNCVMDTDKATKCIEAIKGTLGKYGF